MNFFTSVIALLGAASASSLNIRQSNGTTTNVNVNVMVDINVNIVTIECCSTCQPIETTVYLPYYCPGATTLVTYGYTYIVTQAGYVTLTCPYTVLPGTTTTIEECPTATPTTVCNHGCATYTTPVVYTTTQVLPTSTVSTYTVTSAASSVKPTQVVAPTTMAVYTGAANANNVAAGLMAAAGLAALL